MHDARRRRSSADTRPAARGKTFIASVLRTPVRLRLASLAFGEASSDCVGQAKTIEKEHCGEVRCAHERIEREETSKIGDETYPVTCISLIYFD
ncbi:hypothetical protein Y697_01280 [Mesotoga sp. BH458_6_3_2_1]|nr:hypothetical protein Y697_01280 [Mesotoga sp. BH458_6_3_2_1]